MSSPTAFRNDPRPVVQPDPCGPEGGLRLPVEHARRLRDAREEADPLHHIHAHQGHLLRHQVLNRTSVRIKILKMSGSSRTILR